MLRWHNPNVSIHIACAVRAAMPFLRQADHVTIFTVPETDGPEDKSHLRLVKMLRWHNPNVSIQVLPEHTRPPVAVLLDAAVQAGCGLLVMGGYGHTRLREAVFGGFTRAILEAAPLPVLMAHTDLAFGVRRCDAFALFLAGRSHDPGRTAALRHFGSVHEYHGRN